MKIERVKILGGQLKQFPHASGAERLPHDRHVSVALTPPKKRSVARRRKCYEPTQAPLRPMAHAQGGNAMTEDQKELLVEYLEAASWSIWSTERNDLNALKNIGRQAYERGAKFSNTDASMCRNRAVIEAILEGKVKREPVV